MKFRTWGIMAALVALSASPALTQSPPFNSSSIATLGGNCSAVGAVPYQQAGGVTRCTAAGSNGQVLYLASGVPVWTTLSGSGTVTSVGLTLPNIFSVTGSPITAAGTLAATLASQTANTVFAAPISSNGAPVFRLLDPLDIPPIDIAKLSSGTLPVIRGGTGVTSSTGTGSVVLNNAPIFGGFTGTSGTDVLTIRPTTYGIGNPQIGFNKGSTANTWNLAIYDGVNNNGTINIIGQNIGISGSTSVTGAMSVSGVTSLNGATTPTLAIGTNTTGVATAAFVQANIIDKSNRINPRNYGATCNGATDDIAALNAANAASSASGKPIVINCPLAFGSNISFTSDVYFEQSGQLITGGSITATFAGGLFAPPSQIFNDGGNFNISSPLITTINSCWYGACTGASDRANVIRKMFASGMSGKTIIFPAINYNLCSAISSGYPAFNDAAIMVRSISNTNVKATGATFTTCAAIAQTSAVQIDSVTNFEWDGGAFVGTRSGLATTTVNNPFGLMNNDRLRVANTKAISGYIDAGAYFEGDFNKNLIIENNEGVVGQGVDMAFSLNAVFRNNRFTGASSTAANIGIKAFSHIYDGPLIGSGTTGITRSENILIDNNRFENFITGVLIQEGRHWKITNNYFSDIKGATGSPASGVLISYNPSGPYSNVGNPPWNVAVNDNQFDNLGTVVAGCGVAIGANAIANSDVFNRIIVNGNMFSGTGGSTGICADTNSAAKINSFFVGINEYSNVGALMNANASSLAKPATLPR